MRRQLMLSGTAAVLLAGVSFAAAQGPAREPTAPAAPSAQSHPNAKSHEGPKAGAAQRPDGQSTPQNRGQMQRGSKDLHSTTGQATPETQRGAPHQQGAEFHA